MTNNVMRIADDVLGQLADGAHLLLLTDYDGTLAPIVPDPSRAWLPDAVRDVLRALARSSRVHFGVVSGRDLDDLRERVAVSGAIYAGCYGLDIEGPGMRFVHPEAQAQRETLMAIGQELSRRAPEVPGMRVEAKQFGVSVHYRHVAPDQVHRVEMETARVLDRDDRRFKIFHGLQVIEIQPQVSWTKGDSVLWIRDIVRGRAGDELTVVYIGDDRSDEDAFEALGDEGITIGVGDLVPASKAAHRLEDVRSVRRLLAALADGARGEGGS
jgi:trehalose-phosphatase